MQKLQICTTDLGMSATYDEVSHKIRIQQRLMQTAAASSVFSFLLSLSLINPLFMDIL